MKPTKIGLIIILAGILNINPAATATKIKFAKGSYCGMYAGNISGGKEFVLNLAKGQTLTTKNIGSRTQYNIFVRNSTNVIKGEKIEKEIHYYIPKKGNYRIYIESKEPHSSIEFCAY